MLGFAPLGGVPLGARPLAVDLDAFNLDAQIVDRLRFDPTSALGGIFSASVAENMRTVGYAFHREGILVDLADGVAIGFTGDGLLGYFEIIEEDLVAFGDSVILTKSVAADVLERFQMLTDLQFAQAVTEAITEGMVATDALEVQYGMVLLERIAIRRTLGVNQILQQQVLEAIGLVETLRQLYPVDVIEGVQLTLTQLQQLAITMRERIRLEDPRAVTATYNLSVATQAFRLVDSFIQFVGADIADTVTVGDALTSRLRAIAQLSDTVGLTATTEPLLLLNVVARDGVAISATDALNALFSPTMFEGVEITAGYVAPDGNLTTWVMNTRTGAVSEYEDFEFNSFARVGNKYIGASDAGLYELLGDTDEGANIVPRIRSGYLQFGGTRLSRLAAAYIAVRGEGQHILRIFTSEGAQYDYLIDARDGRMTKVHMGKGQRARSFSFELVGAGQDFDLDLLEFVPIVVKRRV